MKQIILKAICDGLNVLSSLKTAHSIQRIEKKEFLCLAPCLTGIGNHILTFHFLKEFIAKKFSNAKFILLTRHSWIFPDYKPEQNIRIMRLPISKLMETLETCALLVSNDSGPAHMAGKLNIPVIVLFGPTSPAQVCPIGKNTLCVENRTLCSGCTMRERYYECHNENQCLKELQPQKILELIKEFFG